MRDCVFLIVIFVFFCFILHVTYVCFYLISSYEKNS